jgi:2-iminobutanoate/2-iminopropanoate deaminase
MKVIETKNAPSPIGPYSQAIEANGTFYISGQVAIDPATGEFIKGTVEDEARLVMKNLKGILEHAGLEFGNVAKATIFLKDMADFAKVNEIYGSNFSGNFPARETVEVSRLPKDAKVEISFIVIR